MNRNASEFFILYEADFINCWHQIWQGEPVSVGLAFWPVTDGGSAQSTANGLSVWADPTTNFTTWLHPCNNATSTMAANNVRILHLRTKCSFLAYFQLVGPKFSGPAFCSSYVLQFGPAARQAWHHRRGAERTTIRAGVCR